MRDNSIASSQKFVGRFRRWVKNFAGGIFSAPYLPIFLGVFFIVTVVTQLAIVLMSQPLSYWSDPANAVGLGLFGEDLAIGAGGLIAAAIVYMAVAVLLLTFVNYRLSLVGWFVAELTHFYFIQESLGACYMSRWSTLLGALCQFTVYPDLFWSLVAIVMGILLAFTFQPAAFSLENKKIEKSIAGVSFLVPIVWVALMVFGVIFSAQKPAYGWIPVEVKDGPRPTRDAEAAYDAKRNRLVMFGGAAGYLGNDQWDYNLDTWEWDGNRWINAPTSDHPEGRSDHSMAFDEKRGVTVLFGGVRNGVHLSDTWEWDGHSWTRVNSSNDPIARSGHEMIYDPVREKVVLYGGYDGETFHNDAWEWDGKKWSRLELESGAPVASVYALAYDPNQKYALGFLSGSGGTWRWKGKAWTRLFPEIEPRYRGWSTLVYDPSRKLFFLFGGMSNDETFNDTWTFDGQKWTEYTNSGVKPSTRADMVIWYDPIRKHIMLFGGYDGDKAYGDTWEFILPEE